MQHPLSLDPWFRWGKICHIEREKNLFMEEKKRWRKTQGHQGVFSLQNEHYNNKKIYVSAICLYVCMHTYRTYKYIHILYINVIDILILWPLTGTEVCPFDYIIWTFKLESLSWRNHLSHCHGWLGQKQGVVINLIRNTCCAFCECFGSTNRKRACVTLNQSDSAVIYPPNTSLKSPTLQHFWLASYK